LRLFTDSSQAITPLEIAEDASGYLWLAAEQGVFRFDGRHFARIAGPFGHPLSLAILAGSTVLVGTDTGLFQYHDGSVARLTTDITPGLSPLANDLVLAYHFPAGLGAKTRYDAVVWADKTLRLVHQNGTDTEPFWALSDGLLWRKYGDSLSGAPIGPELRDAVIRGDLLQYHASHAKSMVTVVKTAGSLFALLGAHGALVYRNDSILTLKRSDAPERRFRVGDFTRSALWRPRLFRDREARIWIPGDELWVGDDSEFHPFRNPRLEDKQVMSVFEDSRGVIWFGLAGQGLASMGTEPAIESWNTPPIAGPVNALIRADAETLYAATEKGKLFGKHDNEPWKEVARPEDASPISQIAAGTSDHLVGLIRLGPPVELTRAGRILKTFTLPEEVRDSSARRLVRAPDGTYFIGCNWRVGLCRIEQGAVRAVPLPSGSPAEVQDIVFDSQNRALVAYQGGVCRIDGQVCRPFLTNADGLLTSNPRSIGIGKEHEIWISYRDSKALTRLDPSGNGWQAQHLSIEQDTPSAPETQFVRRDRRNWIWRGTDQGLFVSDGVHTDLADWIQLTERDGLPSASIARFGLLEDSDGSIWIGTASGIAHARPTADWFAARKQVAISQVSFGQAAFYDGSSFPTTVKSPGAFTARFASPSLLPVRYRLLPVEPTWRASGTAEAHWDRLGAGHYQLEAVTGRDMPVVHYAFDVADPARTRWQIAILVGILIVGLASRTAYQMWQHHRWRNAPLPAIGPWREAALSDLNHALSGVTLDSRYEVGVVLEKGGFATVFAGRDLLDGNRLCAIKVFDPGVLDDEWSAKRFRREVSALERIEHPNIVRILGHGVTSDREPYLVMEYIEGQTLRSALQDGLLAPKRVAALLRQAGSALDTIHAHGILHRDIKPENLMLRAHGPAESELVIIDFSIALVKDRDRTIHELSRAGGTLDYMPPEQHQGHAEPASDIYSLAKVVVEMLTGLQIRALLPTAVMDLPQEVRRILTERFFGLSPVSLDLMSAALEFHPASRPKNAGSFAETIADDLERVIPNTGP
jgi:tRNA A-37 threonylcarbamoyl transferase component Bud32/ligand-binding sensor domain-containing protein